MLRPHGLPPRLAEREDTLVMGILNVTPDSFSDGGEHDEPAEALAHARALLAAGAAIIDVGGESTRPGAERVDAAEELRRVLPVVGALARDGVCVSVDTMRAEVAAAALEAGAMIVNDVSGGLADPEMPALVARARTAGGTPPMMVAMHWRGHADVMSSLADYDDIAVDVASELAARVEALTAAGVERRAIVADPGLGFAKRGGHDWDLLARWETLDALGLPLLIGVSRKRSIASLTTADGAPLDRDAVTAALTTYSALRGAWCVRVHDVGPSVAGTAAVRELARHRDGTART